MTKEETLNVINEIIEESAKSMKEKAEKMLDSKNFDFDVFGDRNTFARIAFEVLVDYEISQYMFKGNRRKKDFKDVYYSLMNAYISN